MSSTLEVPPDLIGSSGLYNSPDPLLRRLRLEDSQAAPITDIEKYFREKDLVVLYAGSEQGAHNLTDFHKHLSALALRSKSTAVIYVSTDIAPAAALRATAQQPWLRLTFHDDSDFAPLGPQQGAEVAELSRGEEFVQAGEIEIGAEVVTWGVEEYQRDYVRPLSRAAVSMIMRAYSTPNIAVYHIASHDFVARNVRTSELSPARVDKNLHTWRNGGTPSVRLVDIAFAMRWPLIFLVFAAIYNLVIFIYGPEYNVIPGYIDQLSWRMRGGFGAA